jgi:hypothetical protein
LVTIAVARRYSPRSNFEGPDVDAALALAAEDRDWQVRAAVDQLNKATD